MSNVQEWQQLANKELSRREKTVDSLVQQTAEGIAIKPLYTEADLDNLEVTGTLPGLPPYVRGPRATMYTAQPWTILSMLVSRQQKSPTLFIAVTWPPTEATTPITHAWRATSAKRASLSTPGKI
ncbi:methylmalonyl-CoA mutase [Escherichia coli]|nr:methylmalonyl-CoA mutase [Escherichia coli]